jgi:hypothetical protein
VFKTIAEENPSFQSAAMGHYRKSLQASKLLLARNSFLEFDVSRDRSAPHPMNAAGPFYVEDGCCIACGVPESEAPSLFGWENNHCYVRKQPETFEELEQMTSALFFSEVDCIRYRGSDEAYITRMVENGLREQVDSLPNTTIVKIIRDHVLFDFKSGLHSPIDLATEYQEYLRGRDFQRPHYQFRGPFADPVTQNAWLEYSWFQERFHRVNFSREPNGNGYLIQISSDLATRSIALKVYEWLQGRRDLVHQKWFSAEQWIDQTAQGASMPL